jgi:hypothetical protein
MQQQNYGQANNTSGYGQLYPQFGQAQMGGMFGGYGGMQNNYQPTNWNNQPQTPFGYGQQNSFGGGYGQQNSFGGGYGQQNPFGGGYGQQNPFGGGYGQQDQLQSQQQLNTQYQQNGYRPGNRGPARPNTFTPSSTNTPDFTSSYNAPGGPGYALNHPNNTTPFNDMQQGGEGGYNQQNNLPSTLQNIGASNASNFNSFNNPRATPQQFQQFLQQQNNPFTGSGNTNNLPSDYQQAMAFFNSGTPQQQEQARQSAYQQSHMNMLQPIGGQQYQQQNSGYGAPLNAQYPGMPNTAYDSAHGILD